MNDEEDQVFGGQIAVVLKSAKDGASIGEVCRRVGIREATYYNWGKKCAGPMPSEMKRLRQLEERNAKLKRLVTGLSLNKAMLRNSADPHGRVGALTWREDLRPAFANWALQCDFNQPSCRNPLRYRLR
ncbi:hypothetical protein EAO27_14135 [Sphingopyxis sp. YF1]|nr:hypothetical protein EAO27_14135 [Sphingopyxis sp. YF1]